MTIHQQEGTPTATPARVTVGTSSSAGTRGAHAHSSIRPENRKAPAADARAVLRGELIYRGGSRHVASLRDGVLRRNLDVDRETYKGAIMFHTDVLQIAAANGARRIVCTDRETGAEYSASLEHYRLHCWRYSHPLYGVQWALPLGLWAKTPGPGEAVQGALW